MFFNYLFFGRHLDEGEKIGYVVHRHWFSVFGEFFKLALFGMAIPWVLWAMFPGFFWLAVIWSALSYIIFIYQFLDWFFDVWIITDQSIMTVEWNGFFNRNSLRIEYETIDGVGYEVSGLGQTLFGYGTIFIEKPSGETMSMHNAINPKKVELEILRWKEQYIQNKTMTNTNELQRLLSELVAEHVQKTGWKGKSTWGK